MQYEVRNLISDLSGYAGMSGPIPYMHPQRRKQQEVRKIPHLDNQREKQDASSGPKNA